MIEQAEREGLLKPGGTIVEPTSGNTGVGLAIVAAQRGYHCIFVVTDKVAPEKIHLLEAYGAEVVVCPVAVEPDDPQSYYSVAERLVPETPGAFRPNQYGNQWNPWAHEQTTGPEIWRQTAGRITHFVAGVGTGGTITGVGRYLKAQRPDGADRRRRPGRLGVLGRARAGRTWSRASARTSGPRPTTRRSSTGSCRSATRTASSWPGGSPARRACSSAGRAARRWPPPSRSAASSGPTTWWSC